MMTKAKALARAKELCEKLPPGWKPHVWKPHMWENLGWHYCLEHTATEVDGEQHIHSIYEQAGAKPAMRFWANMRIAGIQFHEHGATPQQAICAALRVAQRVADDLGHVKHMIGVL